MVSLSRLDVSQPCAFSHSFIFWIWLIPVTAPSVSSVSSASISGAAALCNLACCFGKLPIDVKAAFVDHVGKLPNLLFGVRQRRQTIVRFALDLDVLHNCSR